MQKKVKKTTKRTGGKKTASALKKKLAPKRGPTVAVRAARRRKLMARINRGKRVTFWEGVVIASCIEGSAAEAIEAADMALKAWDKRFGSE